MSQINFNIVFHTNFLADFAFQYPQVEESLNDMDFQLFLDLYFTDGDYT